MRWLPQASSFLDEYWKVFVDMLKDEIKDYPVMHMRPSRGLTGDRWGKIQSTRRLEGKWYYKDKLPLFTDPMHLSDAYNDEDLDLLKDYGVKLFTEKELLESVAADLNEPCHSSFMKSPSTDEVWHSRAADALLTFCSATSPKTTARHHTLKRLGRLKLIPLDDGTWITSEDAASGSLFYPCYHETLFIPKGLGLRLVHGSVMVNSQRCQLLEYLGVKKPTLDDIYGRILGNNMLSDGDGESLRSSINHTLFLYHSDHLQKDYSSRSPREYLRDYCIYDRHKLACCPHQCDVYMPSKDPYGPTVLFEATRSQREGFPAIFLHENYIKLAPTRPQGQELTWTEWLQCNLGLKTRIQLTQASDDGSLQLSDAFKYVAKHQPEKLIGTLRHVWPYEKKFLVASSEIMTAIQNIEVLCMVEDKMISLNSTYLPLPKLQEKVALYSTKNYTQFIQFEDDVSSESLHYDWNFLVDYFQVRNSDDLDFYLNILRDIRYYTEGSETGIDEKVFDLYEIIQSRCREQEREQKDEGALQKLRYEFLSDLCLPGIYIKTFHLQIYFHAAKSRLCAT